MTRNVRGALILNAPQPHYASDLDCTIFSTGQGAWLERGGELRGKQRLHSTGGTCNEKTRSLKKSESCLAQRGHGSRRIPAAVQKITDANIKFQGGANPKNTWLARKMKCRPLWRRLNNWATGRGLYSPSGRQYELRGRGRSDGGFEQFVYSRW